MIFLQGFFTFAICPHNDVRTRPSRACFAQHPLQVKEPGRLSTYHATLGNGVKRMRVVLPGNMTCSQCILQYTYTSGESTVKTNDKLHLTFTIKNNLPLSRT